jgi:hypothetical protein
MNHTFIKSFAVLLCLSLIAGSFIQTQSRFHRYPFRGLRNFTRQLENAKAEEQENSSEWSIEKLNSFANAFHKLEQNNRTQSIIYTGDFPEIGAKYMLLNWVGSKPYYAKFEVDTDSDDMPLYNRVFSLMESLNQGEESR